MFDLCYANGANLDITNKQGLTPLTLAAKLKRVDVSVQAGDPSTYRTIIDRIISVILPYLNHSASSQLDLL